MYYHVIGLSQICISAYPLNPGLIFNKQLLKDSGVTPCVFDTSLSFFFGGTKSFIPERSAMFSWKWKERVSTSRPVDWNKHDENWICMYKVPFVVDHHVVLGYISLVEPVSPFSG